MTNNRRPLAATAPRLGWVLGLTSTAYFMVVLDSSVVLTALRLQPTGNSTGPERGPATEPEMNDDRPVLD